MKRCTFISMLAMAMAALLISMGFAATYDATGTWIYTQSNPYITDSGNSGCTKDDVPVGEVLITIEQDGNNFTIYDEYGYSVASGTVSGSVYTYSYSEYIEGGTAYYQAKTTLSSCSYGSGSATFSWSDGEYYCKGGFSVTIQRQGSCDSGTPNISVSPASFSAPDISVGSSKTQTFTVKNTGSANLTLGNLSVTGANSSEFKLQSNNCSGKTVSPSGTCSFDVVFSPSSAGAKSATLNIPSNDSDTPTLTASLSGTGKAPLATYTITAVAGEHGTVSPSGKVTATRGESRTFVFSPETGYVVDNVLIDGISFGALDSFTFPSISADHSVSVSFRETWVTISGLVRNEAGTPLCVMVLANGQFMFTCGENEGMYGMDVPKDANGEITLFAFCDGMSPFRQVLTPSQAEDFDIIMTPAPAESPEMTVTTEFGIATEHAGWLKISGEVYNADGTPLCAMILANGQHIFTCGENEGKYELEVPLDANGEITLFGFCDGLQPFKEVVKQ